MLGRRLCRAFWAIGCADRAYHQHDAATRCAPVATVHDPRLQRARYPSPFVCHSLTNSGHQLVASIAQRLLTSKAHDALSSIVSPSKLDLASIAPWADRIKHTHAYWWSSTLHYINPVQDYPPGTCSADFSDVRTPERTLLTAIANYTSRLADESLAQWPREEALRFLVHFMGDAEQPLHCKTLLKMVKSINV